MENIGKLRHILVSSLPQHGPLYVLILIASDRVVLVITPRNSLRLYIKYAREHYKLNKNVGKWWMNARNDAYSSQITTSTMLNPRHG